MASPPKKIVSAKKAVVPAAKVCIQPKTPPAKLAPTPVPAPAPGSSRETSKMGETSTGSERKVPVNRNVYESVEPEPEPGSSSSKGKVANRNFYESVDPNEGDAGTESKPRDNTAYTMLPDVTNVTPQTGGTSINVDDDDEDEDSEKERRLRKKRRLAEEAELMGKMRMIIIGCTTLIGLLLFIAAIAGGSVMLSLRNKKTNVNVGGRPARATTPAPLGNRRSATYGWDECLSHSVGDDGVALDVCLSVKPVDITNNKSCVIGCRKHRGDLFKGDTAERFSKDDPNVTHILIPQHGNTHHDEIAVTTPPFCKDPYNRPGMVCDDGKCGYKYIGSPSAYNSAEMAQAEWVDNCDDHQFHCWDSSNPEFTRATKTLLAAPIFSRSICYQDPRTVCKKGMKAVVYMQLMECWMNEDRVGDFCKFEPATPENPESGGLRLFVCSNCPTAPDGHSTLLEQACTSKGYTYVGPKDGEHCISDCKDSSNNIARVMLPDGAACFKFGIDEEDEDEQHQGYCVSGTCLWWNPKNKIGTIDTLAECKNKQKKRREKKPKFRNEKN